MYNRKKESPTSYHNNRSTQRATAHAAIVYSFSIDFAGFPSVSKVSELSSACGALAELLQSWNGKIDYSMYTDPLTCEIYASESSEYALSWTSCSVLQTPEALRAQIWILRTLIPQNRRNQAQQLGVTWPVFAYQLSESRERKWDGSKSPSCRWLSIWII